MPRPATDDTAAGAREALRLPDGRTLAWSRWGPPAGRPVLFCTGAGMSGSLGFALAALPALGLWTRGDDILATLVRTAVDGKQGLR
jgi:hypothetical protein